MRRSEGGKCDDPREQITYLAHRVRRLCPDHRNPHRFHEEKSEIVHELNILASGMQ